MDIHLDPDTYLSLPRKYPEEKEERVIKRAKGRDAVPRVQAEETARTLGSGSHLHSRDGKTGVVF